MCICIFCIFKGDIQTSTLQAWVTPIETYADMAKHVCEQDAEMPSTWISTYTMLQVSQDMVGGGGGGAQ